jgi:hypothetical protein
VPFRAKRYCNSWTKSLWAMQRLLGHTTLKSTERYLGIKVDDVVEIAEQKEV